jgi:hypothetical protein
MDDLPPICLLSAMRGRAFVYVTVNMPILSTLLGLRKRAENSNVSGLPLNLHCPKAMLQANAGLAKPRKTWFCSFWLPIKGDT